MLLLSIYFWKQDDQKPQKCLTLLGAVELNLTIFLGKYALHYLSPLACSVSTTKVFLLHKVNTRCTSCILTDSDSPILKRLTN